MVNVTLKQLRAFVTLAKHKSFTRAASHLNVSQSALTLQIRDLEAMIGLRLFDRSTRSVDLTSLGATFFPLIQDITNQLDLALDNIQAAANIDTGFVTVVAGGSVIKSIIAPAVANLGESRPELSVKIIEDAGATMQTRLVEGQADFAISSLTGDHNVQSHPLLKDRAGILCRADHPLAQRERPLNWTDLRGNRLVMLRSGKTIRALLDAHRNFSEYTEHPQYEVSSISALLSLVEQGVGISILSSLAAYSALQTGLVFLPVQNPSLFRELQIVHLRRHTLTPPAILLVGAIFDVLSNLKRMNHLKDLLEVSQRPEWCVNRPRTGRGSPAHQSKHRPEA
jgi:DNA-binding transcriptional LysR family regulator